MHSNNYYDGKAIINMLLQGIDYDISATYSSGYKNTCHLATG